MSLRDFGPNELMFILLAARWTIVLALIAFIGGGVLGVPAQPGLACLTASDRLQVRGESSEQGQVQARHRALSQGDPFTVDS